jgi:hypothetical protein
MSSLHPILKRYIPLAPPRWLLKTKDPELFDREYRKQLESLDAKQVVEDLGPNAIILDPVSGNAGSHPARRTSRTDRDGAAVLRLDLEETRTNWHYQCANAFLTAHSARGSPVHLIISTLHPCGG